MIIIARYYKFVSYSLSQQWQEKNRGKKKKNGFSKLGSESKSIQNQARESLPHYPQDEKMGGKNGKISKNGFSKLESESTLRQNYKIREIVATTLTSRY